MAAQSLPHLPKTWQVIHDGIEQGLHHGVQLYVSLAGDVIVDTAIGENPPDSPLTSETLSLWLSSGKPITAVAVLQQVEQGQLKLDQPVADIIPEFAAKNKETVTVRHLLTHTAGLRPVTTGWPKQSWDEIIAKICQASTRMNWVPGEKAGYDPARSWFILGEIVRRIDGRMIDQYVREQILEPLGMVDSWLAIPEQLHEAYGKRIGVMFHVIDGELRPTKSHQTEVCAAPSPGGSMRGPASQLGKFYEMLLRGGVTASGENILSRDLVDSMTSRVRVGMYDETFQHQIDFGLGVIINSNRYGAETVPYGFGRYASDKAFGHGGAQSSIGFADPQHRLVVAAVANGCPGEELHNARFRELNSAIYEDLKLNACM